MFLIPHGAELNIGRRAYVTYAVVILCVLIFLMQARNKQQVAESANVYCSSIQQTGTAPESLDILRYDRSGCIHIMQSLHIDLNGDLSALLQKSIAKEYGHLNELAHKKILILIEKHYQGFDLQAPASLNARLMYYPGSFNPLRMITSALAHADWLHLIGNLIFFMAFAPAIEILIGSRLAYTGFLLSIAFVSSLLYSLATALGNVALPSLGLSGVVMGVIGLSAYLMPKVRIKVLVWLITFFKTIYIPAWILAVWYIGWDIWNMLGDDGSSGINLVAHVSGGISGYLVGYFFLKDRREDISEELHEEIHNAQSMRKGGVLAPSLSTTTRLQNEQQEREVVQAHDAFLSNLHRSVSSHQSARAIQQMIDHYDVIPSNAEAYETLFNDMLKWGKSRALLCAGRTAIHLFMIKQASGSALRLLERCQQLDNNFQLADAADVLTMARTAKDMQFYQAAYLLVRQAGARYGMTINIIHFKLLETELLWQYLNQPEEAKRQMRVLLNLNSSTDKLLIEALAADMGVE